MDNYRIESDLRDLERKIETLKSDVDYDIRSAEQRLENTIDRLENRVQHLQARIEELETLPRD